MWGFSFAHYFNHLFKYNHIAVWALWSSKTSFSHVYSDSATVSAANLIFWQWYTTLNGSKKSLLKGAVLDIKVAPKVNYFAVDQSKRLICRDWLNDFIEAQTILLVCGILHNLIKNIIKWFFTQFFNAILFHKSFLVQDANLIF